MGWRNLVAKWVISKNDGMSEWSSPSVLQNADRSGSVSPDNI